jgi:hypothetical protein
MARTAALIGPASAGQAAETRASSESVCVAGVVKARSAAQPESTEVNAGQERGPESVGLRNRQEQAISKAPFKRPDPYGARH